MVNGPLLMPGRMRCHRPEEVAALVLFPKVRSVGGHHLAVYDQRLAPGDDPPVVDVIVADDREDSAIRPFRVVIGDLARLCESVQFFLPILETHGHIRGALRPPVDRVIIPKPLPGIERSEGAVEPILPFEGDRGIDPRVHGFRGWIEEILNRFPERKIGIERDGQLLQVFDLPMGRGQGARASDRGEKKKSQQRELNHASR